MDKSRQQFEDMAVKRRLSIDKKKDSWGQEKYKYDMIQIMWEGWQASRESLINSLEPVCFGIINEEDGKLFWDRAKNKKERAIYHRDILSKYSLSKKLTISPLYRLDK